MVEVDDAVNDNDVVVDDDAIENNVSQKRKGEMEGQDDMKIYSSEYRDDNDGDLDEELYRATCRKLLHMAGKISDRIRSKTQKLTKVRLQWRFLKEEAPFEVLQRQSDDLREADQDKGYVDNENSIVIPDHVELRIVENMRSVSKNAKKNMLMKGGKQLQVVRGRLGKDSDDKGVADSEDTARQMRTTRRRSRCTETAMTRTERLWTRGRQGPVQARKAQYGRETQFRGGGSKEARRQGGKASRRRGTHATSGGQRLNRASN